MLDRVQLSNSLLHSSLTRPCESKLNFTSTTNSLIRLSLATQQTDQPSFNKRLYTAVRPVLNCSKKACVLLPSCTSFMALPSTQVAEAAVKWLGKCSSRIPCHALLSEQYHENPGKTHFHADYNIPITIDHSCPPEGFLQEKGHRKQKLYIIY